MVFDPKRPAKQVDLDLPKVDLGDKDPFASGVAFTGGKEVTVSTPAPIQPGADAETKPAESETPRDPFAAPATEAPKQPEDPFATSPFGKQTPPAPAPKPKAEEEPPAANPFGNTMPEVAPERRVDFR